MPASASCIGGSWFTKQSEPLNRRTQRLLQLPCALCSDRLVLAPVLVQGYNRMRAVGIDDQLRLVAIVLVCVTLVLRSRGCFLCRCRRLVLRAAMLPGASRLEGCFYATVSFIGAGVVAAGAGELPQVEGWWRPTPAFWQRVDATGMTLSVSNRTRHIAIQLSRTVLLHVFGFPVGGVWAAVCTGCCEVGVSPGC